MRHVLISGCVVLLVAIACTQRIQDTFVGPYNKIWADDQCSFLGGGGGNPGPSLSSCQSSCLDDSPCTAIAYDGSTCYWLECPVPVPGPGKHDPGWNGYSLASATAIKMYETRTLNQVWSDWLSGANDDVSIWTANWDRFASYSDDVRPIGDKAIGSHSRPDRMATLRVFDEHSSLRLPESFTKIWSDKGSGAHYDVTIWRVNCPAGFVSLGNVATDSLYNKYPDHGSVYCVKRSYVVEGYNNATNWKKVWADHGSGADADVTIYEAIAATPEQLGVGLFGAIASHTGYPGTPYLLKKILIEYKGILHFDQ